MRSDLGLELKRSSLRPFAAIAMDWIIILGAATASWTFGGPLAILLAMIVIASRQHALFVMIHEAAHFHVSRNKYLNDWTSDLLCAFPLFFDTDVYRKNHLKHHAHLNSDRDPDWVRKAGRRQWTFPTTLKDVLLFAPYFVFWAGALEWGIILWRFSGFGDKNRWKAEPAFLATKLIYFGAIFGAAAFYGFAVPLLLFWLVPMFFGLPAIGRIRSIAEHFAVSYADELNSSRDVNPGMVEAFLLAPHNVHFHLTHHLHPHIPYYNLRKAHNRLRELGALNGAHLNRSYAVPYADSVLRDMFESKVADERQTVRKAG